MTHNANPCKHRLLHGSKVRVKFVGMPNDHFVPKAYLRGFTLEYLANKKGGELVVYVAASGKSRKVSINDHIAGEPEFYNNHPLDKEWSKTIECTRPAVRNALRERENITADLATRFALKKQIEEIQDKINELGG